MPEFPRNYALKIRLFYDDAYEEYQNCTAFSLEREAYTPYDTVTATLPADAISSRQISRIGVWLGETRIFLGLVDSIRFYFRNQKKFLRIRSKSFTSLLSQNELPSGLHSNLTIHDLIENFYQFPYITYEDFPNTGYIFVKSGSTMWDGIVSFGYKLTGHYPYVMQNHICLSKPKGDYFTEFTPDQILEYGTIREYSKMISHYHMSDLLDTPDAFMEQNPLAEKAEIIRHKHIDFDQSFRHAPQLALTYRNAYSNRGCQADYLVYDGFYNEQIGHKITYDQIQDQMVCKVQTVFNSQGFRTKLICYQDGFYNN